MNDEQRLNDLAVEIRVGQQLSFAAVNRSEIDDLIDARDSTEFEERWLRTFKKIDQHASELSETQTAIIEELREASYKAAFTVSESPDFSAFVSDDFEMIGRPVVLRIHDPWLNGLWLEYKQDRFPAGNIDDVDGELSALLS